VLGTKGLISVGSLEASSLVVCSAPGAKGSGAPVELMTPAVGSWRTLFLDAYRAEDQAFVDAIAAGREPSPSGRDGLKAVEAVVAGNRSIASGLPVKL
jgi:predicted dehydrogenase